MTFFYKTYNTIILNGRLGYIKYKAILILNGKDLRIYVFIVQVIPLVIMNQAMKFTKHKTLEVERTISS